LSRAVKSQSKEVEDELASMRGTGDVERISYLERKEVHGVSSVEEEPRTQNSHTSASLGSEVSSSRVLSQESSSARPGRQQHSTGKLLVVFCGVVCFLKQLHTIPVSVTDTECDNTDFTW